MNISQSCKASGRVVGPQRQAQPQAPVLLQRCSPVCAPFVNFAKSACISHPQKSVRVHATPSSSTPASASVTSDGPRDRNKGRSTYRPASFAEIVEDAVCCVKDALRDGITRMEVEFPPLPTRLDGYKGASDLFIDSNVQLALAAARQLSETGKKVHVLMPDQGEYDRTYKMFSSSMDVIGGGSITLGHLKESGGWSFTIEGMFQGHAPESKEAGEKADLYLITNATCVELFNVREYVQKLAPAGSNKAVVLWNLELDSLRGDMGLPAFPPKDMHYDFLSTFRPVYYLRTRDYSKSVPVPPYLVNYSGALFREYPGPWQVMLKQDSGEYACIAEDKVRYNLGELKEELQAAMGLNTEEEGSAMQVLRRGVKNSTWWEDDYEVEKSHEWRL